MKSDQEYIRPKKQLGQHFLKDLSIARKTVEEFLFRFPSGNVVEIGPGKGVLTEFLVKNPNIQVLAVELDKECIPYLNTHFAECKNLKVVEGDFLRMHPDTLFDGQFSIVGNFPYNISSQIVFKTLEWKDRIPVFCGMFQKEVAERICSSNGKKDFGILSVLAQTFYYTEYLFTVSEDVFVPPPKVKSAVMRMTRKENFTLPFPEKFLFEVVKAAFNQRRKMLRNGLHQYLPADKDTSSIPFLDKRVEQLTVPDFWLLAEKLYGLKQS